MCRRWWRRASGAAAGRPVASAAFVPTTPAGDAGRINAVSTLEEERGKGYASACVAALSTRLLARGWRYCLMFADRHNPITTRIYPRLGYEETARFASIGLASTHESLRPSSASEASTAASSRPPAPPSRLHLRARPQALRH